MGASRPHFYFSCDITITEAKNMDLVQPTDTVFLRLYLSAGNTSQKIQLNTQDLPSPSSSGSHWNEPFSLECTRNEESMKALRQESIVFELQTRRKASILGPNRWSSGGQSGDSVENRLGVSGHGNGDVGEDGLAIEGMCFQGCEASVGEDRDEVEDRSHGRRGQEGENKRGEVEEDGGTVDAMAVALAGAVAKTMMYLLR